MNLINKKAKKILFNTFWKNGWIDSKSRCISSEDFEYAKANGLMFEPLSISHDDLIRKIAGLTKSISADKAARAFLSSFSTRRLDWRSSLASWHCSKGISLHTYKEHVRLIGHSYENGIAIPHESHECEMCGGEENYREEDLNVLNFERIRWGGVRHGELIYTLLDMEQLDKAIIPEPSRQDIAIFNEILKTIESSGPTDAPGTLCTRLKDVLSSNKNELSVLLEILGFCGVLEATSADRPGLGGHHDWKFVADWRGEDHYNKDVVGEIFGGLL